MTAATSNEQPGLHSNGLLISPGDSQSVWEQEEGREELNRQGIGNISSSTSSITAINILLSPLALGPLDEGAAEC